MRFGGVENSSRQEEITRDFVSNLPDENRGNNRRHEPDPDLGISELCFWNCQRKVAHRGQASAAGNRCTVYRRNRRFGEIIEPAEDLGHALRIVQVLGVRFPGECLEFPEVHPCTKRFAGARQDQHVCRRLLNFKKPFHQLIQELEAEGIALLRTVKSNRRHACFVTQIDSLKCHARKETGDYKGFRD